MVFSPAVKEKQRGRPSGGLIILIKKHIQFEILDCSYLWIFLKVKISSIEFILGNVYINPTYDMTEATSLLEDLLAPLLFQEGYKTIIGGDFNGRVADGNFMADELAEELGLLAHRVSLDHITNRRGEVLTEYMESRGFLMLNGRTTGDIPGQFTYLSKVGKSVVDLAWCNPEFCSLVKSLQVSGCLLTSDHLPVTVECQIYLTSNCAQTCGTQITRYIWSKEKSTSFSNKINENLELENCTNIYDKLMQKIDETASELNMKVTNTYRGNTYRKPKQPWYNGECRKMKSMFQNKFRKWKRSRNESDLLVFIDLKAEYFKLCSKLRNEHEKSIKDKLRNVKNASEFWKTIFLFKTKPELKCQQISLEEWTNFLQRSFPTLERNFDILMFYDVHRPDLDSEFCIKELDDGIAKLKNEKSPGPDGILNEHLKTLGEGWRRKLLNFLNTLFDGGEIPEHLVKSYFFMLHKKGDSKNPDNYRSIALMNNLLKLFTQMLTKRLMSWCEDFDVLIESQNGFRSSRGCMDNVFSFSSVINLHLMKRRKLYVALVDFKSAFSEVDHDLLWSKLFSLGISAKIICLLRKIYSLAKVQIRVVNQVSEPANVTKGVLQGESVSPLLFLLFLNDLEEYFKTKGSRGVPINELTEILLLLYCDDLVIFASDRVDLQRKLNLLEGYCETNHMLVNINKTKVVIFRQGGRLSRLDKFYYKNQSLEICEEYNYLGILFSSHGVFYKASEQSLSKGRLAVANVRKIMCNSKMDSWESRIQLYNSVVKATLLYGAEVWGFRYGDHIEKCQVYFFKSIFCLPRNTPNYALRLEMGMVKIMILVFKQIMTWWCRLLKMSEDRIPKICYNQLKKQDERGPISLRFNWVSQLRTELCRLGYSNVWEAQDPSLLKQNFEVILDKYSTELIKQDWDRLSVSTYYELYKELKPRVEITSSKENFTSSYLLMRVPIDRIRIAAQLRLCGRYVKFYIGNMSHTWDSEEVCSICNQQRKESVQHFLMECPQYCPIRKRFLDSILSRPGNSIANLLEMKSKEDVNNIFFFVQSALKIRSFILRE
ncbi:hypothetical protein M8J77_003920 [Diaphorina citri]|nr:hypothetical protein M8J77_003920 [Diaphorina citri]